MATLFEYKCKSCGYTKAANPKGHDMIMSDEQGGAGPCLIGSITE